MYVIVDVQCFRTESSFVAKELSVCDMDTGYISTWCFQPPYPKEARTDEERKQDGWLTRNFHGMEWSDGDVSYGSLKYLVMRYTHRATFVFAKGREKCAFLKEIIKFGEVIDLGIFDCPPLHKLKEEGVKSCCNTPAHKTGVFECSFKNCVKLASWFRNHGDNLLSNPEFHLNSFDKFPRSSPVKGYQLARAGFFYSGNKDIAVCSVCGVAIGGWETSDVPCKEHRRWSPHCPLVRGAFFTTPIPPRYEYRENSAKDS